MNEQTSRYLEETSIEKLMLKFSIPSILSLLVSSLYNIVDQIFIGRGVGYLGNGATDGNIAGQIVSAILGIIYLFHTKTFQYTQCSSCAVITKVL